MFFFTVLHYNPLQRVDAGVLAYLARHHPDRELVNFVVDGFTNGFSLGMTSEPEPRGPCENLSGVLENPLVAQQMVDEEVAKGHMLGPFDEPPLPNLIYSPINLVPKGEDDFRLIHDLSYPYDGVNSINDCIPPCNSRVRYHSIDDVIDIALRLGQTATGSRVDIAHAFRNLGIRFEDIRFLAFTLNGKIYLNVSLPFRAASSCCIFEKVATLLQWIVTNETGRDSISHYLDDFPLLGASWDETKRFVEAFYDIMARGRMLIAKHKTIGPTHCLLYLGLLLNFREQVISIPQEKRDVCIELIDIMLQAYRSRKTVVVKTLQSLAGHLNFLCQAVPAGKTFLSSLFALSASKNGEIVRPGHHRRQNKEIHDDLVM